MIKNQLINQSVLTKYTFQNRTHQKSKKIPILAIKYISQNHLIYADQTGKIYTLKYSSQNMQKIQQIFAHSHPITCLLYLNPQKNIIASGSQGQLNTIRIWNISNGLSLTSLKGHKNTISALISIHNGIYIGSASYDGTIKIWDWEQKQIKYNIVAHGYPILCLIKSQMDEKIIISGADDYTIKIWNYQLQNCIATLTAHNSYIQSLQLLDNNRFISGAASGQACIWNLDKIFKGELQPIDKLPIHEENVTQLLYLQKRGLIISISEDKSLGIWECQKMKLIKRKVDLHRNSITGVTADQNEDLIFTAGWDGVIQCMNIKNELV